MNISGKRIAVNSKRLRIIILIAVLFKITGCSSYRYHPIIIQYYSYFPVNIYRFKTNKIVETGKEENLGDRVKPTLRMIKKGKPDFQASKEMISKMKGIIQNLKKNNLTDENTKGPVSNKARYFYTTWQMLSMASPSTHQKKEIIKLERKLVSLDELSGDNWENNKGVQLALGGKWPDALIKFKKCSKSTNKTIKAMCHNNLGVTYELRGMSREAEVEYSRAILIEPENEVFRKHFRDMIDLLDRKIQFIKESID